MSKKSSDVKASRPKWPRGKNFGLGLDLVASASVSCEAQADPPCKKIRTSLFGHYRAATTNYGSTVVCDEPAQQLSKYVNLINSENFSVANAQLDDLLKDFVIIQPLFERLFCVPASSAPVERVFSQSWLILSARRARMSNTLLETLVFTKCNADLSD